MFSVISSVSGPVNGAKLITREIIKANENNISDVIDLSQAKDFGDFGKFSFSKVSDAFKLFSKVLKVKKRSIVYFNFTPQGYVYYRDLVILFILVIKRCSITSHIHTNMFIDKFEFVLSYIVKNTRLICINTFQYNFLSKYGKVYYLKNSLPLPSCDLNNLIEERLNKKTLVYLSNIDMKKGFKFLKQTADLIHERFNGQLTFIVIGGILDPKLTAEIEEMNKSSLIKYMGVVTDEFSKFKLLNNSYMFLFLSEPYYEAFPLTYIEALSCGLPIITTKQYCTDEVIKNNGVILENGDMAQIEEFIIKCFNDTDYYKELCQNSKKNFENNFSFSDYIKRLNEIIYHNKE